MIAWNIYYDSVQQIKHDWMLFWKYNSFLLILMDLKLYVVWVVLRDFFPAPLQAVDSRDSMAMALYSQCFNWIIHKLNNRIRGKEDFKSISILDIFGFENFEVCLN